MRELVTVALADVEGSIPFVKLLPARDVWMLTPPDSGSVRLAYAQAGWSPLIAREPYYSGDFKINLYGHSRGFNLSGDRPFIYESGKYSDIATVQADGLLINEERFQAVGVPPYVTIASDSRLSGFRKAIRVALQPTNRRTVNSWRTQIANYPLQPYRRYAWVLCFRLADNWNLSSQGEEGLLWQLKGQPKLGQYGNPVIALNLDRDILSCNVLYPVAAFRQTWGTPIKWDQGEYEKVSLPTRKIEKGHYYFVQIEFFADDRPEKAGGQGYLKVKLDGSAWIDYAGPTLHPDQAGPHQPLWGWYQWGGRPKSERVIWWLINEGYSKP